MCRILSFLSRDKKDKLGQKRQIRTILLFCLWRMVSETCVLAIFLNPICAVVPTANQKTKTKNKKSSKNRSRFLKSFFGGQLFFVLVFWFAKGSHDNWDFDHRQKPANVITSFSRSFLSVGIDRACPYCFLKKRKRHTREKIAHLTVTELVNDQMPVNFHGAR